MLETDEEIEELLNESMLCQSTKYCSNLAVWVMKMMCCKGLGQLLCNEHKEYIAEQIRFAKALKREFRCRFCLVDDPEGVWIRV